MASPDLLIERHGALLTLTLNRPEKRNALSLALLDELAATVREHGEDPGLHAIVVTAAGDRAFAAGGDLKELDAVRSEAQALAMSRRGRDALDALRSSPLPVVAALNGLALGGGAELALACDLRVAVPAAEIGFLQGQLNVTTAWGGGIDLLATVGVPRGMELLLTARRVTAAEALGIGLVNRVAGPEQPLADCVAEFVRPWLGASRGVATGYKALAAAARRRQHQELARIEQTQFVMTWTHAEHWDAVAAAARRRQGR